MVLAPEISKKLEHPNENLQSKIRKPRELLLKKTNLDPNQNLNSNPNLKLDSTLTRTLGAFLYFSSLFSGELDVEKIFSLEKYQRRTLPQPKTSSADVIVMSHHRNNAYVTNAPQFRQTEIFREPLNEFQR